MSYQVLARKWRPATFEQMVGQSHVLLALTNALTQQRLHHAYLFTGTRGVGKTSLARLFAKGLNCEQGVSATPCGKCASCIEIAEGRFVDLIEVDAASRTKVDDTRELLDNVQYRPTRGRYKVYLIDEVHMLSRSSFNALLKTLEEPPEHVKFLLATTDPQKLPVTVLSRCLQFNLKSLTQTEISQQLEFVLNQEQIPFELSALNLLAKAANGSMRDGLSLTDQAIAFSNGQVSLEQVQSMLGSIDEQHVIALLSALCDADVGPLLQCINRILAFGADADEVLRSLLELLHQITLTQFAPAAAQQSLFSEQILAFAKQISAEQVQLYYQLLLNGRKDLPHAPDPKSGLEMALLRAVAFVPEKVTHRWVVETAAEVNVNAKYPQQTQALQQKNTPEVEQEVIDTGPKLTNLDNQEQQDQSLVAEQAMLLSQAQSLGFEEYNVNDTATKLASSPSTQPQKTVSNEDTATESASISVTSVSAEATTEKSNTKDIIDSNSRGNELRSETQVALENDQDNEQQQISQTRTKELKKAPVTEFNANNLQLTSENDDGYYMAMADMASQSSYETEQGFDHYQLGEGIDTQANENSLIVDNNNVGEATKNAIDAADATQTNQNPQDDNQLEDFDDDLDAVLACRDSLMAEINALNSEEHAVKETDTKTVKLKKPAIKTTADEKPITDAEVTRFNNKDDHHIAKPSSSIETTLPQYDENRAIDTPPLNQLDGSETTVQTNAAVEIEQYTDETDRPPWVKPAEPIEQSQKEIARESSFSEINEQHNQIQTSAAVDIEMESSVDQLQALGHEISGDSTDLQWYRVMSQVKVGGRVRQLGVNSVCEKMTSPLKLTLKPNQKHLAAPVAIEQLQAALFEYYEIEMLVEIEIGLIRQHETPLEMRKRFHQELTSQATHSLMSDANVQWMRNRLSAELNADSVVYPAEKLTQVANLIPILKDE